MVSTQIGSSCLSAPNICFQSRCEPSVCSMTKVYLQVIISANLWITACCPLSRTEKTSVPLWDFLVNLLPDFSGAPPLLTSGPSGFTRVILDFQNDVITLDCNYLNADFYFGSELMTHPGSGGLSVQHNQILTDKTHTEAKNHPGLI